MGMKLYYCFISALSLNPIMADSVIVANVLRRPRVLLEKHLEYVVYAVRFPENELDENVKQLFSAGHGTVVFDMIKGGDEPNLDIYE